MPIEIALIFSVAVLISVITTVIIILLIRSRSKSIKDNLEEIAQGLGAELQKNTISGLYRGTPFMCRYTAGSRNAPASLAVSLSKPFPISLVIRKEGRFDRFSKAIGLAAEFQTGDSFFDNELYIEGIDNPGMQNFLMDAVKRDIVFSFFNSDIKVKKISFSEKGLEALISPFAPSDINVSIVDKCLNDLARLSEGVESVPSDIPLKNTGIMTYFRPALILLISFDIIGIVALIAGSEFYQTISGNIYLDSLYYSVPSFLLFSILLFFLIRGRSQSHKFYSSILGVSLPAFIAGIMGGMLFLNGYLDTSKPILQERQVISKYYRTNKSARTYYIIVRSLKDPDKPAKITVGFDFYKKVKTDRMVLLHTKSGFFGYEWLISINLKDI